jgi:FkbM family methyltransferase
MGLYMVLNPSPDLYNYLSKRYNSKHIHLKQQVLSDGEEEVSFFYFPGRTGVSGLSRRSTLFGELTAQELKVKTCRLDDIMDLPRIDLIKIDVEGAELKVLRGAKQHMARCRPVVVFESGYGGLDFFKGTPEEIYDLFDEIGYGLSLLKYYLEGQPHFDRATFLYLFRNGYEFQFIAYPK